MTVRVPSTTRRALLGGAGIIAVVATTPVIAAAGTAGGINPAFAKLCSDYRIVKANSARTQKVMSYYEGLAIDRVKQMRAAPIAPTVGPLDTSLPLETIIGQTKTPEWKARWAAYERDLAAWKDEQSAIYKATSGESDAAWEAALRRESETIMAIRDYPVTTIAELNQKAAILHEQFGDELEADDALALVGDIARLAEMAA